MASTGARRMMANSSRDPYWQGERPARDDRSSGGDGGNRGRRARAATCRWSATPQACRTQGAGLRPPAVQGATRWRQPRGRRRVVLALPSDRHRQARHPGEFHRRLRHRPARRAGQPSRVRPVCARRRAHAGHADLQRRLHADPGRAHPQLGDVRDVPYADHRDARAGRHGGRTASRAGAVPGVAAQRLQGRAELPVVPHAGGRGAGRRSRASSASRAQHGAARVRGGELLRAAHAEPLSRRARRRGAAAGARRARPTRTEDYLATESGAADARRRRRQRRPPGNGGVGRESRRPQAADRVSLAARLAPLRRARQRRARRVRIGRG